METAPRNRPTRRRLGMSLRALMLAVLVAGLWMARQVNEAREQREVVAAVRKYGGWVRYDWQFVNGKLVSAAEPRAPRWLRGWLGDELFQDIAHVSLVFDIATGEVRHEFEVDAADEVLARLAGRTGLKSLQIGGRQATDRAMRLVERMSGLEELTILTAFGLSDEGVARIAGLKNLKRLNVNFSGMTDAGLAHLGRLANLEELSTTLCPVTDAGIAHLKRLENLGRLDLDGTGLTDLGLEQLIGMNRLKTLGVGGTQVTAGAIERLEAAKPDLRVIR